jgi:GTPase
MVENKTQSTNTKVCPSGIPPFVADKLMTLKTLSRLVAIVGRPNVGKSTLFNALIRERKSLVHDEPGVTRDRILAKAEHEGCHFYLCDTGGFEPHSNDNIKMQLVDQAELAIQEANLVIFAGDAREGLHPVDAELIRKLRKANKKFIVAANKCDLPRDEIRAEEFRKLGVEHLFAVSAEHRRGLQELLDCVAEQLGGAQNVPEPDPNVIKLALVGRPNVGKSSLLNRIVGEKRSIVDDKPGTTRDTVDVSLNAFGKSFVMLDTAGIRRKSRMVDNLERFSALRSVSCVEEADVSILVVDAKEGPTEGDARVAGYAFELRRPILIVVNKWDLLENKTTKSTTNYLEFLHERLRYLRYAPVLFTSAIENQRTSKIIPKAIELYEQSTRRFSTSKVNEALKTILVKHTPPLTKARSRRIKFFYATQVGVLPPRFVVFCSDPKDIHFSYKRYVENEFRNIFEFNDVPISIVFRERSRNSDPLDRKERRASRTLSFDDALYQKYFANDLEDDEDNDYVKGKKQTPKLTNVSAKDIEFDDAR